jgi:hypothetical protein
LTAFEEVDDMAVVICGGSSPMASRRQLMLLAKEIYDIQVSTTLTRPLKWSKFSICFDHQGHMKLDNAKG